MNPFEELPDMSYKQIIRSVVTAQNELKQGHVSYWDSGDCVSVHIYEKDKCKYIMVCTLTSNLITCDIITRGKVGSHVVYIKQKYLKRVITEYINSLQL